MNLQILDWVIVGVVILLFVYQAFRSRILMKSTVDFLAANRSAGRYMLSMAGGIAGLDVISIVLFWEVSYGGGLSSGWWNSLTVPITIILAMTAFIIYRFRETRSLTLPQFLEVRYGRRFRIFAGLICWFSGVLNFGIFPLVGARFFMTFCRLPETFPVPGLGIEFSTFTAMTIGLVSLAAYFVFVGGQVSVMITDFLQMLFVAIVMFVVLGIILYKFGLREIFDGLLYAEPGKSMVNPFDVSGLKFKPDFWIIGMILMVINRISWASSQSYYASSKSPHEQKMAGVIQTFVWIGLLMAVILIPYVAYMIMHHPDYADLAHLTNSILDPIKNQADRNQMLVPATLMVYLPVGIIGAFAAVMWIAFVSTHNTSLHAWGSILIQDVIVPLRNKPLSPKWHMRLLRLSICGVGIIIIVFSNLFEQSMPLAYWTAITGAIWLGGASVFIIGGLYTRWGTTLGACAALISGMVIAVGGIILDQRFKEWYQTDLRAPAQWVYLFIILLWTTGAFLLWKVALIQWGRKLASYLIWTFLGMGLILLLLIELSGPSWCLSSFPWPLQQWFTINGQRLGLFAVLISGQTYVAFSLFGKVQDFDLDRLLHRGKYAVKSEHASMVEAASTEEKKIFKWSRIFGVTEDFTVWDKVIYWLATVWNMQGFILFLIVTTIAMTIGISNEGWADYHCFMWRINIVAAFIFGIWICTGGIRDLIKMLRELKVAQRDEKDDGYVRNSNKRHSENMVLTSEDDADSAQGK